MNTYFPAHVHSDASLLDAISTPEKIAEHIVKLGLPGCAITDHGDLGNTVEFFEEMKKVNKKPVLGCEMYISDQDATIKEKENRTSHLVVLAKNLNGWKSLLAATSDANKLDVFYKKPRLDLDKLSIHAKDGNLISFSGHMGSALSDVLFIEPKLAYNQKYANSELNSLLKLDWKKQAIELAGRHLDIFGKGNFYIEIQLMDQFISPVQLLITQCLREVSKATGIPCVGTPDAHYIEKKDAIDQRVLLCSSMNTSFSEMQKKIDNNDDVMFGTFFKSSQYHIPSFEEMRSWHTDEELSSSLEILEKCEDYEILSPPILPNVKCPNDWNPTEYLRQICREGWAKLIQPKIGKDKQTEYVERIKYELSIIEDAKMSSYFIICRDIMNYVRSKGWLVGPGRGSSGGCLTSFLSRITSIDSVKYNLSFERFYNISRKGSMPDIDMDIPAHKRDEIIQYIQDNYGGEDHVCQMITYGTMKGKNSVKTVLRSHGGISPEQMNEITRFIPDPASIADELQEMEDEFGDSSNIMWALENNAEQLRDYCRIEDGKLAGPLCKKFEQAIRLEGVKNSRGKHPSGVAISRDNLKTICPMVLDTKTKKAIIGLPMKYLEKLGIPKFDILGLTAVTKMMYIKDIVETGDIQSDEHEIS